MRFILKLAALLLIFSHLSAQTKSAKRGICGDASPNDLAAFAPYISWYYNWGVEPPSVSNDALSGIEWVPMQWGAITDDRITSIANRIPADSRFLLGFNEPNFKSQANLTPEQAAAMWPYVESIANEKNLLLVSPAVNWCGGCVDGVTNDPTDWLDKFIAACPDCRFDYIAVHNYNSYVTTLKSYLDKFRKYGKPLWLTEFAPWDDPVDYNGVVQYMKEVLPYLENEPLVYRYSWFATRVSSNPDIDLLGENGTLTKLGQLYASMPFSGDSTAAPVAPLILLPENLRVNLKEGKTLASVTIEGTTYYRDSEAVSVEWSQVSGPSPAEFSSLSVTTPTVSGLQLGTYLFQMTARADGKSDSARITVQVNAANLALNKPVSASSSQGNNSVEKINDGNPDTRWSSLDTDPQWITIDLEASHTLTGARIVWETAFARTYSIDVSQDSTEWVTVFSTAEGTGGAIDYSFTATGRYIRMASTERATKEQYWGVSIFEFEVFGTLKNAVTHHPFNNKIIRHRVSTVLPHHIQITIPDNLSPLSLSLFNSVGRRLYSEKITTERTATIATGTFKPGFYILRIKSAEKEYSENLLIVQ